MMEVRRQETVHALRTAAAAIVCLVLVEFWNLPHSNLAVYTTYLVLTQHAFTAFQKGVERILGRGLGLVIGLALLPIAYRAPAVALVLKLLALLVFFYLYFAGRLAYAFLNAGFYVAVITAIGMANPEAALPEAYALILAIVVGVIVAELIGWASGAESDLHIRTGDTPLWPLDGDRLRRSLMLVVTVALTQLVVGALDLPVSTTLVSVMVLTITPDLQSLLQKGHLRLWGAILGMGWAVGSWALLCHLPHFTLLAALLFLGLFLATYLTQASSRCSYVGLQMGLVLSMVLVVPSQQFGSILPALERLEGAVIAIATSLLVGGIGTLLAPFAPPPTTAAQPGPYR